MLCGDAIDAKVYLAGEISDEVLGVVRGGLHSRHTGSQLRRHRLLHLAQNLAIEVERQDRGQDLLRVLLEDHVLGEHLGGGRGVGLLLNGEAAVLGGHEEDLVALGLNAGRAEREHGADGRLGGDEGGEAGVEELDAVSLAGQESGEQVLRDLGGLGRGRRVTDRVALHNVLALAEILGALAADGDHVEGDPGSLELADAGLSLLDRESVVATAEAAVTGHNNEENLAHSALSEERGLKIVALQANDEATEHLLEGLGERASLENSILGTANLGGRNETHSRGDLAGVLNRGNAIAQLADIGTHNGATMAGSRGGNQRISLAADGSTAEGGW
jgi:hypothetical protein